MKYDGAVTLTSLFDPNLTKLMCLILFQKVHIKERKKNITNKLAKQLLMMDIHG